MAMIATILKTKLVSRLMCTPRDKWVDGNGTGNRSNQLRCVQRRGNFPQRRKDAKEELKKMIYHPGLRPPLLSRRGIFSAPVAFGEFVDVVFGDLLESDAKLVRTG